MNPNQTADLVISFQVRSMLIAVQTWRLSNHTGRFRFGQHGDQVNRPTQSMT